MSAYSFPSVFNAPAVYFIHSVHPSRPQADASASVTGVSELAGASCKSRTGCVSSTNMSKRVFSLSAETVVSASICSNTLYCAYHRQPRLFLSLLDTFDYILRHNKKLYDPHGAKCLASNETAD